MFTLISTNDWTLAAQPVAKGRRSKASPQSLSRDAAGLPHWMLARGAIVAEVADAAPKLAGRRGAAEPLLVDVDAKPDRSYLTVARHASGALTFHPAAGVAPLSASPRRSTTQPQRLRFQVSPPSAAVARRRGAISSGIKLYLLEFAREAVRPLLDAFVPEALKALEKAMRGKDKPLGFVAVTRQGILSDTLSSASRIEPGPQGCALLLLHGTFSSTAGAFKGFAGTGFFERAAQTYGDKIYGFDHLSLSLSPEDNARELLNALPGDGRTFDVITHSRGGLVLRSLLELPDLGAALRDRFQLNRAVMVAAPNQGTPLVTPARWRETVGWLANLLEMFPDNPFTTAPQFVANGLVWLAETANVYLPGLAAMDAQGDGIARLAALPDLESGSCAALVTNYAPPPGILARLADMGIDSFFGGANDLVVPTEGGWKIDAAFTAITPSGVGCFGRGGNIVVAGTTPHHLDILARQESAQFIERALNGLDQQLPQLDLTHALGETPKKRASLPKRSDAFAPDGGLVSGHWERASRAGPEAAPGSRRRADELPRAYSDTLSILIVEQKDAKAEDTGTDGDREKNKNAMLVASYGGARVIAPFRYRGGDAGKRSQSIIKTTETLRRYVDGEEGYTEPNADQLIEYGTTLFEWIFGGEVRPLYDVARTMERDKPLNIIFTSMIDWVADKPVEFAYDPVRKTFLATEEIHFIRSVLTTIPADQIEQSSGPLSILVIIAQPVVLEKISAKEEESFIRRSFQPLIDSGLVRVDVIRSVTPARLHGYLSTKTYDVVHFIGHGELINDEGHLIFEDGSGNSFPVSVRTAREIFCKRNVKLIFLNSCESGRGSVKKPNTGIAQALVAGGIPAVVANQFKVLDTSATAFAQHFYWQLAQGRSIGAAAREARIATNYAFDRESIDWAVPVVYARDPDGRLCPERLVPEPVVATEPSGGTAAIQIAARRGKPDQMQIAVWDVNYVFPHLHQALEKINNAQSRFRFQLVDTSAPIGTWREVKADHAQGELQLDAHNAARKLRGKTAELGVDYLVCITNRRIFDDEVSGLFQWAWDEGAPADLPRNITFFSTAISGLPMSGRDGDRVLANAAVVAIAEMAGGLRTHEDSARTAAARELLRRCPNFYNERVDLTYICGTLAFCKDCAAKLARRSTENRLTYEDVQALNLILALFADGGEQEHEACGGNKQPRAGSKRTPKPKTANKRPQKLKKRRS